MYYWKINCTTVTTSDVSLAKIIFENDKSPKQVEYLGHTMRLQQGFVLQTNLLYSSGSYIIILSTICKVIGVLLWSSNESRFHIYVSEPFPACQLLWQHRRREQAVCMLVHVLLAYKPWVKKRIIDTTLIFNLHPQVPFVLGIWLLAWWSQRCQSGWWRPCVPGNGN